MVNGSNSTNPTVYPASNLRYVDPHMRLIKFIPDKTQATFPEFITAPTYVPNKGTANSISAFFSPQNVMGKTVAVDSGQIASMFLNPAYATTYATINPDKSKVVYDACTNMNASSIQRNYQFRDYIPLEMQITYAETTDQTTFEQNMLLKQIPHYSFVFLPSAIGGVDYHHEWVSIRMRIHFDDV